MRAGCGEARTALDEIPVVYSCCPHCDQGPGGGPCGIPHDDPCEPCEEEESGGAAESFTGYDAAMTREDGFDPVGITEIAGLPDPPMSKQLAVYVMNGEEAPEPVQLARMKVWRASEVIPYLRAGGRKVRD
jgi:hypothetical protein